MRTKTEILLAMVEEMPFDFNHHTKDYILTAMEIYADEKLNNFKNNCSLYCKNFKGLKQLRHPNDDYLKYTIKDINELERILKLEKYKEGKEYIFYEFNDIFKSKMRLKITNSFPKEPEFDIKRPCTLDYIIEKHPNHRGNCYITVVDCGNGR